MTEDFSDLTTIIALIPGFEPLRGKLDDYFEKVSDSMLLPLDQLISTRLREKGVRNAFRLMEKAARGETPKRAPLTVASRTDGKWDIVDGNSTVAVARASGWSSIPCREDRSFTHE